MPRDPGFTYCLHSGNRWSPYPAMAPEQQQPVVIDLTQDDSGDEDMGDMDIREPPPSHHSAVANEGADGQDLGSKPVSMGFCEPLSGVVPEVSEAEMTQSSSSDESDDDDLLLPPIGTSPMPKTTFPPRPPSSTCSREPPARPKTVRLVNQTQVFSWVSNSGASKPHPASVTHPREYIEILEAFTTIYNSEKNLDNNRDIELSDIHDSKLRDLTKELYEVVSKHLPSVTVGTCRDALTGVDGWRLAHAIISVIGISNNDKVDSCSSGLSNQTKQVTESSSTNPILAPPHNHQENSTNGSDGPWEVFHSFLTIQRTDFASGKDFLRACEKLRVELIAMWNLRFTQKFIREFYLLDRMV